MRPTAVPALTLPDRFAAWAVTGDRQAATRDHLEGHPALEGVRTIDEASLDASERLAREGAETPAERA